LTPVYIPTHASRGPRFIIDAMDASSDHTTFSFSMSRLVDGFDLTELLTPIDTEEARQRWGEYLNRLYPSNTIYLDAYDPDDLYSVAVRIAAVYDGEWPSERRAAAHELYTWFQEVIISCETESERARIRSNYNLARAIVTPVHRLPEEILANAFLFVIDDEIFPFHSSFTFRSLFGICRRWHSVLQRILTIWSSLTLRKWTDKDYVQSFLSNGKGRPLDVTIYTNDDSTINPNNGQPYGAIEILVRSAERLGKLTLRTSDSGSPGPLATPLQNHISTISVTAKKLTVLDVFDGYCIPILSKPSLGNIFSALTSLSVRSYGVHEPVNILPHLLVIRHLSLYKVALTNYGANGPLPLINSLEDLDISHTSTQWMAGREFKQLHRCHITFPHHHSTVHPMAAILPVCSSFRYCAHPLASLSGYVVPSLYHLHVGNRNSDKSQNRLALQHIQNFLPGISLRFLSLKVESHDQHLLQTLRLLPTLEILQLEPKQPQSLGSKFFSAFIVSPHCDMGCCDHWWCPLIGSSLGRQRITMCPLLTGFIIKYGRWLRRAETEVVMPILQAIDESRQAAGIPILDFVLYSDEFVIFDLKEGDPEVQAICGAFQSAVQHHSIQMIDAMPQTVLYFAHGCFSTFLYELTELTISMDGPWSFSYPLDVLRHCRRLKSLSLTGLPLLPYPMDQELPLVHTLCRMTLTGTSLAWMSGRTFTLLKECRIVKPGQEECSRLLRVYLPICTLLECQESPPELLSKLQAPQL